MGRKSLGGFIVGSKLGVLKIAAKKSGLSFDEYMDRVNSGLKRCTKCNEWKNKTEFNKDQSRGDGLSAKCISCTYQRQMDGPTKRERRLYLQNGLAWCRDCKSWLNASEVKRGRCKKHWAEYARTRYSNDERFRLERLQHAKSHKRNIFPIPPDIQIELLEEFNGRCAYCLNPATTWDHIVSIAEGGNSTPGNVVPCCLSCNSSKKAQNLYEWLDKKDKRDLHPKLLDILSLAHCVPY